jgi:hypothetical protein
VCGNDARRAPLVDFWGRDSESEIVGLLPFPFLLVLGLLLGWAIWDRWLATAATILLCALLLLPFAAASSLGSPTRDARTWAILGFSFALALFLTQVGIAARDAFERRRPEWTRLRRKSRSN